MKKLILTLVALFSAVALFVTGANDVNADQNVGNGTACTDAQSKLTIHYKNLADDYKGAAFTNWDASDLFGGGFHFFGDEAKEFDGIRDDFGAFAEFCIDKSKVEDGKEVRIQTIRTMAKTDPWNNKDFVQDGGADGYKFDVSALKTEDLHVYIVGGTVEHDEMVVKESEKVGLFYIATYEADGNYAGKEYHNWNLGSDTPGPNEINYIAKDFANGGKELGVSVFKIGATLNEDDYGLIYKNVGSWDWKGHGDNLVPQEIKTVKGDSSKAAFKFYVTSDFEENWTKALNKTYTEFISLVYANEVVVYDGKTSGTYVFNDPRNKAQIEFKDYISTDDFNSMIEIKDESGDSANVINFKELTAVDPTNDKAKKYTLVFEEFTATKDSKIIVHFKQTSGTTQTTIDVDTAKPLITWKLKSGAKLELEKGQEFKFEDYVNIVSVLDNRDGDLKDKLVIDSSSIDTSKTGKQTVTLTVTDSWGNEASENVVFNIPGSDSDSNMTTIIIIAGVAAGLIALGAVAMFVLKKK